MAATYDAVTICKYPPPAAHGRGCPRHPGGGRGRPGS